jgi:pimeloyl-ACP methyl ester carboxylesterase
MRSHEQQHAEGSESANVLACMHACKVTLVAESFGGCLGLRVAAAAPDLVQRLVLVNPATSFARALGGLPGMIASTNLLSMFPAPLYQVRRPHLLQSNTKRCLCAPAAALPLS